MQVRIVRVIRFLFSAMMDSTFLGGESGVEFVLSSADVADAAGGCACCAPRLPLLSKNGFGVGARF